MMPYYSMTQDKGLTSVLKWEVHPDFSRESVVLLAGAGSARTIKVGQLIAMLANEGKAVAWDPDAADGSEIPWGIAATDAEAADGVDLAFGLVALRRQCLCFANGIVWPEGVSDAQKAEALEVLEAQGIVTRFN
ncbi:head decoration protein [Roseibium suaedae]|uniref:Bacteriophage lambda head decoration protein D n=1 Tax=Roseibium suaedae TaxID=735517 RepID=A0A1M7D9R4_9HYPH|nr:head decoration protein [Roseibium suaedae]SHL75929.1 Bacteriophage lambda head decoration protein D [Roseibium suaedae]